MPKFVRIQQKSPEDLAKQVVGALRHGAAVVPLLGGYCILTRERESLEGYEGPYRLVAMETLETESAGLETSFRERVLKAMAGPLVGRFSPGEPGLALASEPMAAEIVRQARGDVWFGVPEDTTEPDTLADQLGKRVSIVVAGGPAGPGPTVLDFSSRPVVIDRRGKLGILDVEQQLGELVRIGPGLYFSVLTLCTGNSCRSPMAHCMLAKMVEGTVSFLFSAGTDAPVGNPAAAHAVTVMEEEGLDLTRHRAQQLTPAMIEAADLILVMEDYHRERVVKMAPDAAGRTRLLLTFVGSDEPVGDPIGFAVESYRMTREVMRPALERVAAEVRQRTGANEVKS